MFSWCSHGNFLYFGLQSFCLHIIFSFCWFYCFDMSTVIGSALLTPPHPPSTPTISCISNLCAKLQNIRASLTAWSSAPTRSTSCFLFYFDSSCFLCLVSRLTSPSDSLGALPSAVSSPVTLPSLSCMYLFSHSPIVLCCVIPHACLFPCTAFPEFSTISCPVYVFFSVNYQH